uniref:HMA domain-containing protein n=2 Tax=Kalanchoe fedtschenkoi TaxID=63787 RepID=A0A7N0U4P2_KALFE
MMIKQKIVLKVDMHCDKCQKKTRKIAASTDGFLSMSLELDKDQLVIVGVGVDAAALANSLRKKVGHTSIVSIEIVKTEAQKKEEEAKKKKEEEEKKKKEAEEAAKKRMVTWSYSPCHNYPPPPPPGCDMICYGAPSYPNTWFTW